MAETIKHPGKFEGEPTYAPYVWEHAMNDGECLTDGETTYDVFTPCPSDVEVWPDLASVDQVVCWEDEQGFVHTREMTFAEVATFRQECETAYDRDVEENG